MSNRQIFSGCVIAVIDYLINFSVEKYVMKQIGMFDLLSNIKIY
jgi:hypothetical protein